MPCSTCVQARHHAIVSQLPWSSFGSPQPLIPWGPLHLGRGPVAAGVQLQLHHPRGGCGWRIPGWHQPLFLCAFLKKGLGAFVQAGSRLPQQQGLTPLLGHSGRGQRGWAGGQSDSSTVPERLGVPYRKQRLRACLKSIPR